MRENPEIKKAGSPADASIIADFKRKNNLLRKTISIDAGESIDYNKIIMGKYAAATVKCRKSSTTEGNGSGEE